MTEAEAQLRTVLAKYKASSDERIRMALTDCTLTTYPFEIRQRARDLVRRALIELEPKKAARYSDALDLLGRIEKKHGRLPVRNVLRRAIAEAMKS